MNPITDCSKCPKNTPPPNLPIKEWYWQINRKVTQDKIECECKVIKGKMNMVVVV